MQHAQRELSDKQEAAYLRLFYEYPAERVWELIDKIHPEGFVFRREIAQSPYLKAHLASKDTENEQEAEAALFAPVLVTKDTTVELPKRVTRLTKKIRRQSKQTNKIGSAIRIVGVFVALCVCVSLISLGLSTQTAIQTSPVVEAQSGDSETQILEDTVESPPFWFQNEVHHMVVGSAKHQPDWWHRKMREFSIEELQVFDKYLLELADKGGKKQWVASAENRVSDVREVIQVRLETLETDHAVQE